MTRNIDLDAGSLVRALIDEHELCERNDPSVAFGRYNEHHLSHALARSLESQAGAWVVLEAYHPTYRDHERCDLYAKLPGGGEIWLEIKRGWHGTGPDWKTKPSERLEAWVDDVVRLRRIEDEGARRAFVLLHYSQLRVLEERKPDLVTESRAAQIADRIRRRTE